MTKWMLIAIALAFSFVFLLLPLAMSSRKAGARLGILLEALAAPGFPGRLSA